ncbi:MAG: hypothetical protein D3923_02980 [Candidatus Electrothrix sp. AR3]|nr:hypothetical protein [Candidatus Electrothrix sp. AR3]
MTTESNTKCKEHESKQDELEYELKRKLERELEMEGNIRKLTSIQMDFNNGTTLIAPDDFVISKGILGDIKDIIDIGCKLTGWCGGGSGGSGGSRQGCYTIITPDGTSITICPPSKVIA